MTRRVFTTIFLGFLVISCTATIFAGKNEQFSVIKIKNDSLLKYVDNLGNINKKQKETLKFYVTNALNSSQSSRKKNIDSITEIPDSNYALMIDKQLNVVLIRQIMKNGDSRSPKALKKKISLKEEGFLLEEEEEGDDSLNYFSPPKEIKLKEETLLNEEEEKEEEEEEEEFHDFSPLTNDELLEQKEIKKKFSWFIQTNNSEDNE